MGQGAGVKRQRDNERFVENFEWNAANAQESTVILKCPPPLQILLPRMVNQLPSCMYSLILSLFIKNNVTDVSESELTRIQENSLFLSTFTFNQRVLFKSAGNLCV